MFSIPYSQRRSDLKQSCVTKRYTMVIEAAGHPEARREVVLEAHDDGDAYDQANDHAAAELPYHCTVAIAKIEVSGEEVRP